LIVPRHRDSNLLRRCDVCSYTGRRQRHRQHDVRTINMRLSRDLALIPCSICGEFIDAFME
jgi:hypothetical protein